MKHFVIALCILALVTTLCIVGTVTGTRIIDELLEDLQGMQTNLGRVPKNAEAVGEAIRIRWEKDFFWISMLHPHQHLDEVKQGITSLQSYAHAGEYAEWAEAHAKLTEALLHLRGLLKANIDNIL